MRQSTLRFFALLFMTCALLVSVSSVTNAAPAADPVTLVVNSDGDAGDANATDDTCETANGNGICTLRAAIQTANRDNDADTINFAIAGGGVPKITVASALPEITQPVILDASTQAGGWIELTAASYNFSADGFYITGGDSTVRGFVINGFYGMGIFIENGGNNLIAGNRIGTNVDGTDDVFNYGVGVYIKNSANNQIGGSQTENRNLISGNTQNGIAIFTQDSNSNPADGNHIKGNFIGTDVTGTAAIPNNGGIGITNASNNLIGGDSENARNIISGNGSYGIDITGTSSANVIKNNYIGANVDGTSALSNGDGIFIGNPDPDNQIINNLISGNTDNGIELDGLHAIVIQGNKIGTTADGNSALGNAFHGIEFTSFFHNPFVIGGDGADEGNTIRFNGGDGIFDNSTGLLRLLKNRISDNGGLGVDMGLDGVNENDNDEFDPTVFERNYPVLTSAQVANGETTIQGTLHSEPFTTHRLDFYRNAACDPSGNGEGDNFLGTYNTPPTDENGDLTFTATLNAAAVGGEFITALNVSDGERNSEFSACVQVSGGGGNLGTYYVYDLDGDSSTSGNANALNSQGQAVYNSGGFGYLWFSQISIDLGLLADGQTPVVPHDLNASAQIVGEATASNGQTHAFVWQDGAMTDLGTLSTADEYSRSWAYGINADGVIVGSERHINSEGDALGGAVKWVNGTPTVLPHAPNCAYVCGYDDAYAINANGQIVGQAQFLINNEFCGNVCGHAAIWDNGGVTVLDDENYTNSVALDINDNGQMVGVKVFHQLGYEAHAMMWTGAGGGTSLMSNGFDYAEALAINNNGVVVGYGADYETFGFSHAFLWTQATGMVDLNTLLDAGSGWILEGATDINDRGEIIGYGRYNGQSTGFVLRPSDLNNIGGAPLVVNSTADANDNNVGDGVCFTNANECTLRAAIQEANSDADLTKIYFNIPGDGVPTIAPNSPLPEITKPISIDGGTQHDCNTLPCIELAGQNTNQSDDGLIISAGNSTVRGLIINRFSIGITLKTKGNNKIEGNYIGTDATGMIRRPNRAMGILIDDSGNNQIGGTLADSRNVISGNGVDDGCVGNVDLLVEAYGQSGISIRGSSSDGNIIQGNYIGTNKNGTGSLYNSCLGIGISTGATLNIIGGTTPEARNLISGNSHTDAGAQHGWGIFLISVNGSGLAATIQGNYIGTDVNGTNALENAKGLVIAAPQNTIGGTSAGAGNLISGNNQEGILLEGFSAGTPANVGGNRVQGNLIGVDATGTQALANNVGIHFKTQANLLVGGTNADARNVISGNTTYGLLGNVQAATGIRIQGNAIGTDAQGTLNLGNGIDGINVATTSESGVSIGGKQQGAGNMITHNGRNGVFALATLSGTPNVNIRGNSIFANVAEGIKVLPDAAVPTVRSSQYSSNKLKVKGSLNGEANKTYNLDFYANTGCDAGEFGEGETYLGSQDVTTDAGGKVNYEYLASNVPSGTVITATATRNGSNTGSFSRCRTMTAAAPQAYAATNGDCEGNTPCFDNINDAIDAADPDGTVNIAPGTYNQDIVLNGDVNLNMGQENGGGGDDGGGNRTNKKVARKATENLTESALDADDYIINGSLSILNGNFQAPSTNLYISGNLTLQDPGNFNNNNGTVILNGSGTQNINGDFEFNHLNVNSGVIANAQNGATYVNGTFTNNGVAQNQRTRNVNDTEYFETFEDIAGRTSAKLLTTGNPHLGSTTIATILNQTPQTACSSNMASNPVTRWYNIERASGNENGIGATVRLYYNANELNGALEETLKIYHCNTTTHQWEALTTTRGSDYDGDYLQAENVASFSPFGLGGNNGAPTNVTLSKFNAKANKKGTVKLVWTTEAELDVIGFNLLRADKHGEFARLNDTLIAAKNSGGIGTTKYNYRDKTVSAGKTYQYRLEIVRAGDTQEYSDIVQVKIKNAPCVAPAAVTLLTPTNGEKTKRKLVLDWSDANCAAHYELNVQRGGKQKQDILNANTLTTSHYAFDKLDKGKHQWRVRACNDNGCGEWSNWVKFVVQGKTKHKE